jgi:hypothetical protein
VTFVTLAPTAQAQEPAPTGVIEGTVSTQNGAIRLPGAVVVARDASRPAAEQVSDSDGRFRFDHLDDGQYRIAASLDGFKTVEIIVTVSSGAPTVAVLDLPIAVRVERVDVKPAPAPVSPITGTIATEETVSDKEADQFTPGGGFKEALRLLASVIEVPSGLSIKGGRPNQSAVQIGPGTLIDPSTGYVPLVLPADSIDSISVLPNPYAVEFGRFSSGLVVIQTRRASDEWRVRFNNFDPTLRTKRHEDYKVVGLQNFAPRVEIGGPLIKDRLFLEQTAQYRYTTSEVPSRPETDLQTTQLLTTFTRLDGTVSPRHSITATGGIFPSKVTYATLGTFTPPDATADVSGRLGHVTITERAAWSSMLLSETTVRMQQYRTEAEPQGSAPMELRPDTTFGNFFNRQRRDTSSYQWIDTISATHDGPMGLHLLKFGVDLLHSSFTGSSSSNPVIVERADGTPVRRLDYTGPAVQDVQSTDLALFGQDRLQPSGRWYLEFGGRVDRDGVLERTNVTPRVGTALLLDHHGDAILRGGYGLFYERTPSIAGAFTQFETATETRFTADGVTTLGPPTPLVHVTSPDFHTSRGSTWNVSFDHRLTASWSIHGGVLSRNSTHELIVNPIRTLTGEGLLLSSDGRSTYHDAEVGVHYTRGSTLDITSTYVRSAARGDLNSFMNFFGTVLTPIVGANAYAPTSSDMPNRLLVRGRLMPTPRWLFLGIGDWRSGFPYSIVDDALDFVGPRNSARFPSTFRLDLGVEHKFKLLKWEPWIGVRVNNALDTFLPTDVQSNLSSAAFGSFYNSDYRQFRLQVRFER